MTKSHRKAHSSNVRSVRPHSGSPQKLPKRQLLQGKDQALLKIAGLGPPLSKPHPPPQKPPQAKESIQDETAGLMSPNSQRTASKVQPSPTILSNSNKEAPSSRKAPAQTCLSLRTQMAPPPSLSRSTSWRHNQVPLPMSTQPHTPPNTKHPHLLLTNKQVSSTKISPSTLKRASHPLPSNQPQRQASLPHPHQAANTNQAPLRSLVPPHASSCSSRTKNNNVDNFSTQPVQSA